jgi:hypothetical protein
MHDFKLIGVACFILGPPVPYGNAKGSTASIGHLCSFAKLPPCAKTVGAEPFIKAQANFLEVS